MSTADLSLEQIVSLLSEEEQEAVLTDMELDELPWDWGWTGRPSQILPVEPIGHGEDWELALLNAGRGFGKTRAGAEYIRDVDKKWSTLHRDPGQQLRVALLGRTAGDVRDTILNGPSGLLRIYPPSELDKVEWISSQRRVNLPGGGFALCFSAEEPDQLRGPAFHVGWGDELAAYKQVKGEGELDAWTNLRIAVRLGMLPQVIATTTPKRVKILRELIAEIKENPGSMLLRTGKTTDNIHLAQSYLQTLFNLYGGTTLGAQELDGLMLDEVKGATVSMKVIEDNRVTAVPHQRPGTNWLRVVSVDPSVAEKPNDECGITVIYAPATMPILQRHAYVVDDLSLKGSPTVWADVVVRAAIKHRATIVVENNQGGGLVRRLIKERASAMNVAPPPIRDVWSSRSKAVRAEPIGAAYERGRVHHLNTLVELEDQLSAWTPEDRGYSPDRLDAVVHGLSALLFPESMTKGGGISGAAQSHSPVGVQIPRVGSAIARRSGLRIDTSRAVQRTSAFRSGAPGMGAPRRTLPARLIPPGGSSQ
ncbi:terminase large subunit domain-containing protein [Longimicrobium sp.]|uniref:terminase large subunit domain-containing protein n=1 Tax=Longimicrobium sp. TaxID=2029185 RepID=UPI002ED8AC26